MPPAVTISGHGTLVTELTVPDGAQSLRANVACTSGDFHISANTDLANDRHGRCGGMSAVVIPLPEGSRMEVTVAVDQDESLVGQLSFSADPIDVDQQVADDCEALGIFYALFQDAEVGFDSGLIDEGAWRAAIDDAAAALDGMTPTPMIEPQVVALSQWISAVDRPGFWLTGGDPAASAADSLAGQVCTDNGSTIRVLRQYGG
jgi:hypothetical protein